MKVKSLQQVCEKCVLTEIYPLVHQRRFVDHNSNPVLVFDVAMLITKVLFVQLLVDQQVRFSALVYRQVGAIDQTIVERHIRTEMTLVYAIADFTFVLFEENETVVVQRELVLHGHVSIAVDELVLVCSKHAADEKVLEI